MIDNKIVLEFINSKDIRSYLEQENYNFSVSEYAFLIWQSRSHSIAQRHKAFNYLLETTDSCLVKSSSCVSGWDLHQAIRNYIAQEDRLMEKLLCNEPDTFYVCEWFEDGDWHGGDCFFTCYENAYQYAMEYASDNPIKSFHIQKKYIDNSNMRSSEIQAQYNSPGDMMEIDLWGDICETWGGYDAEIWVERFDEMWFDIPIPFKPGDIVCECYDRLPFVISSTVPWYRKEHPPKRDNLLNLTNMDMSASGYSVDNDTLSVKYNWLSYPYLNLEYYKGDLSGGNRILTAYSLFKNEKINGDTLVKLCQLISAEWEAKRHYKDIDWMLGEELEKNLEIDKYREAYKNE